MGITVVTGWHPAAYKEYAHTFVQTFHQHWPASINLIAYTEEPAYMPRGECRSLWEIPGAREFYERHRNNPVHCGRAPHKNWLPKDHRRGQSWRWDAVRFFKQLVIPYHASLDLPDGDALVWLDADVVTFAPVPETLIDDLLSKTHLCYLGRNKGAEIGFWAVRLGGASRQFLRELSECYLEDRVFGLNQFHSAYVFDHVRQDRERHDLGSKNLTPWGRDHVFVDQRSPVMRWMDHAKGSRKKLGYSPEHPLRWWEKKA